MKKVVVGYLFNESRPRKDEELFLKQAKKKGIELVMINTAKDLNEEEIEKCARRCSIFYNNSAEEFSSEIAKTIEALGKKVIDSSKDVYYTEDKWTFFVKCKEFGIPTPRTILLSENINIAKRELKKFDSWPVVLKRVTGTMGEYVDKAESLKEAEKIILKFWKKGSEKLPVIAQELIHSPSYRVMIIGGKIVQTTIKENKGWKATGVYAKHFKKIEVDKKLEKLIKKILKFSKIKICGIDLLKRDGEWLVLEINSEPAFDFFVDEREKLIGEVLDYIKKQARHK